MTVSERPASPPQAGSPALARAGVWLGASDQLFLWAAAALTGVFFVCVVIQIVVRYAFEYPLPWTEELSRYAFVWASFLAAAPIVGRNQHFMIDMLVESLSGNAKRICLIVAAVCTLAFTLLLAIWGSRWALRMMPVRSSVLELSQGGIYAIVPLTGAYMSLHMVLRLLRLLDWRDQEIVASPQGGEDPC